MSELLKALGPVRRRLRLRRFVKGAGTGFAAGALAALVLLTALCNTLLGRVMASSWALIVSTLLCAFAGSFFVELKEEADV